MPARTKEQPKTEKPMAKSVPAANSPPIMAEHEHPQYEHGHEHGHELVAHSHHHEHDAVPKHGHDPHEHDVKKHEHGDIRGELRGAVRGLLKVIEVGSVGSEQRKGIHAVRVIIGDAHGLNCAHENTVYEEGDRLICQDCRLDMTEAGR